MSDKPITITDIKARKGKVPLVCLTCYTAPYARILDQYADLLLVGDSLGMVLYGMESTLPVTLDMMIAHGKAVASHAKKACVIVDMNFGSYQESKEQAFRNAARIMAETGAAGVKLEGGAEMAETIAFLTQRAIPVLAHVGLMPQHVHSLGGYRYQGRTLMEEKQISNDAKAVAEAGAFAVVLEGVRESLGRTISMTLPIPTIGIGASPACDGQILVVDDMAGLFDKFTPRFVKQFGQIGAELHKAASLYRDEVQNRTFPAMEHCFGTEK